MFRYVLYPDGPTLAPAYVGEPGHAVMVGSIADARDTFANLTAGYVRGLVNGAGEPLRDIPGGIGTGPETWGTLYAVPTPDADAVAAFTSHAATLNGSEYPEYVLTVGPRGGVRLDRA